MTSPYNIPLQLLELHLAARIEWLRYARYVAAPDRTGTCTSGSTGCATTPGTYSRSQTSGKTQMPDVCRSRR